jgi:DNA (cytosine-5)-methyltransferase 1
VACEAPSGTTARIVDVYRPLRIQHIARAPSNGLTFASAYAGCGGMDIGFRIAGFTPVWSNEIDPTAGETYRGILGDHLVEADIDAVPWPKRGAADLVIGGPPCQGFSVAGKMDPHDPRSQHVDRFFDLVERVRPRAFVMENVKALATNDRWSAVRNYLERRANDMRFDTSLLILSAADFGVPQRRERMFLIGVRQGNAPRRIEPTVERAVTVREAFDRLPAYGSPGNDTLCVADVTPAKRPVLRRSPFEGSLLFNGNGRHLRLAGPAPTLPASMGGNATPIVDQRELETGIAPWVAWYHRRLLRGGQPVKRVPAYLGRITVEEAAQLSGFPLGMTFSGTTSAKFRQIGNAVPPLLALAVARAVAESLVATARDAQTPVVAAA